MRAEARRKAVAQPRPPGSRRAAAAFLVAGLLTAAGARAQGPAAHAILEVFEGRTAKIEVNLNEPLLALLAESLRGQDGDFAELLGGLRWVQVRVFELSEGTSREALASRAGRVTAKLARSGWETIVRIRDGDELVEILVLAREDSVGGLLAFFMDRDKAGFVSIDGHFDPAQLGRLASRLSLGPLAGLDLEGEVRAKPSTPEEQPPPKKGNPKP